MKVVGKGHEVRIAPWDRLVACRIKQWVPIAGIESVGPGMVKAVREAIFSCPNDAQGEDLAREINRRLEAESK